MKIALGSRPAKQTIKAYTDVLQFGKYQGHTIEWVLHSQPSYILWLDENGWTVDGQIVLDAEDMDDMDNYDDYRFLDPYDYMADGH